MLRSRSPLPLPLVIPCANRFVVLPNTPVLLTNFLSNSATIELWVYSPGAGLYLASRLSEALNRELVEANPTLEGSWYAAARGTTWRQRLRLGVESHDP